MLGWLGYLVFLRCKGLNWLSSAAQNNQLRQHSVAITTTSASLPLLGDFSIFINTASYRMFVVYRIFVRIVPHLLRKFNAFYRHPSHMLELLI